MARTTKKQQYLSLGQRYGISLSFTGKHSNIPKVNLTKEGLTLSMPMQKGGSKIGPNVWQFSTTPGTHGTCVCNCEGCYGFTNLYHMWSNVAALANREYMARYRMAWLEDAIVIQLTVERARFVRIHVTGDFFSADYVQMWINVARRLPDVMFWTYTKTHWANLPEFKALPNVNIVDSIVDVPGQIHSLNYGEATAIVKLYRALQALGEDVYLCPCGARATHCSDCRACSAHRYVLFVKHSCPDYHFDKSDPAYEDVMAILSEQDADKA